MITASEMHAPVFIDEVHSLDLFACMHAHAAAHCLLQLCIMLLPSRRRKGIKTSRNRQSHCLGIAPGHCSHHPACLSLAELPAAIDDRVAVLLPYYSAIYRPSRAPAGPLAPPNSRCPLPLRLQRRNPYKTQEKWKPEDGQGNWRPGTVVLAWPTRRHPSPAALPPSWCCCSAVVGCGPGAPCSPLHPPPPLPEGTTT